MRYFAKPAENGQSAMEWLGRLNNTREENERLEYIGSYSGVPMFKVREHKAVK
jgi:hypothetical protein